MKKLLHLFATLEELYANKKIFAYAQNMYDIPIVLKKCTTFTVILDANTRYRDLLKSDIKFNTYLIIITSIAIKTNKNSLIKEIASINNDNGYIHFTYDTELEHVLHYPIELRITMLARDLGESSIEFPYPIQINKEIQYA